MGVLLIVKQRQALYAMVSRVPAKVKSMFSGYIIL
jgi:hypothetical protein